MPTFLRNRAKNSFSNSMKLDLDPFESAKSHFFDTSSWGEFCDVTLTLKAKPCSPTAVAG